MSDEDLPGRGRRSVALPLLDSQPGIVEVVE
jgi:hypothetical protein